MFLYNNFIHQNSYDTRLKNNNKYEKKNPREEKHGAQARQNGKCAPARTRPTQTFLEMEKDTAQIEDKRNNKRHNIKAKKKSTQHKLRMQFVGLLSTTQERQRDREREFIST